MESEGKHASAHRTRNVYRALKRMSDIPQVICFGTFLEVNASAERNPTC